MKMNSGNFRREREKGGKKSIVASSWLRRLLVRGRACGEELRLKGSKGAGIEVEDGRKRDGERGGRRTMITVVMRTMELPQLLIGMRTVSTA